MHLIDELGSLEIHSILRQEDGPDILDLISGQLMQKVVEFSAGKVVVQKAQLVDFAHLVFQSVGYASHLAVGHQLVNDCQFVLVKVHLVEQDGLGHRVVLVGLLNEFDFDIFVGLFVLWLVSICNLFLQKLLLLHEVFNLMNECRAVQLFLLVLFVLDLDVLFLI